MQALRLFRLLRVFRILKLGNRFQKMQIVAQAMADSSDVMVMLAFVLGLTMLIFAALVYEAEQNIYSAYDPQSGQIVRLLHVLLSSLFLLAPE